ncbi:MAG: phosphoglycerate kinase [Candidatus Magasanikbacteria bacterium]|nr:phosphoglycerate kinase [Candidatus Magasanikbacteria bacterium]
MKLKTLKQLKNLTGKRVMVRVDFNVQIKKGKVVDDSRLHASVETINYLQKQKAKILLVTHIGRPEGFEKELSVKPVAKRLGDILKKDVGLIEISKKILKNLEEIEGNYFDEVVNYINTMKNGQVVLLENIRFFAGERNNSDAFSKGLASLCDVFVLDGFAVAHRASPSVVGVANNVKSCAGLLLEREVVGLTKVLAKPKAPFVTILGGAKMETKVPVMKKLLPVSDYMLVSGGIYNTYLKAMGYGVGDSIVDSNFETEAFNYGKKKKVILPLDVVVGSPDGKSYRLVNIEKKSHEICKKGEAIYDMGPATIGLFAKYIKHAKTLVWNGALGYFEQKPYHMGTFAMARLVASRSKGTAYGVIGGGETVQTMELVGMTQYVDLVSTGGGAMLEFLSGKELPGVVAVSQ